MECFFLEIKVKYNLSVYDTIVLVIFQRCWLLLRWQKGRKEAWFRLLLVRIYEKIFAGLKSLNLTLNQLYLKKAPEETNDQHQKQRSVTTTWLYLKKKNYVNYNVHPRGCTDSNVRIIYQVKRFFFNVNLIKWYFSGPVNLEKKKLTCVEESTACLSSPGQANFDFH